MLITITLNLHIILWFIIIAYSPLSIGNFMCTSFWKLRLADRISRPWLMKLTNEALWPEPISQIAPQIGHNRYDRANSGGGGGGGGLKKLCAKL